MDIPSASEARAKALSLENEKVAAELSQVVHAITGAVRECRLFVLVNSVSPPVRGALEAKGYKVRDCHDPRPGESCSVIEW